MSLDLTALAQRIAGELARADYVTPNGNSGTAVAPRVATGLVSSPSQAPRAVDAPPGVEFVGAVPSSAVPPLLQRARAVLVPSLWYEGQPRTILEAYAAGVPVIASDIGGLPEVVEEGVSGVLVAPGDAGAWTKALHRLLDDSEARRLGQGAHAAWRALYTPERGLANLEQAYREARGKGTPRHR